LDALHLDEGDNSRRLRTIIEILEKHRFYIVIENGQESCEKDEKLAKDLACGDTTRKAKALLRVFYHIRCNLFHGRKGAEECQKELFDAVNPLLEQVVDFIHEDWIRKSRIEQQAI